MALPRTSTLVFSTSSATPVSGFSKAKRLLDREVASLRHLSGLPPLPSWTLHDLRRTMVTVMNEQLGIQPHVVEAVVNHTSGSPSAGWPGFITGLCTSTTVGPLCGPGNPISRSYLPRCHMSRVDLAIKRKSNSL